MGKTVDLAADFQFDCHKHSYGALGRGGRQNAGQHTAEECGVVRRAGGTLELGGFEGLLLLFFVSASVMRVFLSFNFIRKADLRLAGGGDCYLGCTGWPMGLRSAMGMLSTTIVECYFLEAG